MALEDAMKRRGDFDQRIGRILVPSSRPVPRSSEELIEELRLLRRSTFHEICPVKPRQGCYSLTFLPESRLPVKYRTVYRGTLRFEEVDSEVAVSADLYRFNEIFPLEYYGISRKYESRWGNLTVGSELTGSGPTWPEFTEIAGQQKELPRRIPIYPRRKYYSFLECVSADLITPHEFAKPCHFSLTFDEYVYQHPDSGFDGSFPDEADRTVHMRLEETRPSEAYAGKLFEGDTELGSITLVWVSSFFRRAELEVRRLEGAFIPQPVPHPSAAGVEDFSTIFATAGWQLKVSRDDEAVALPASLEGVQDPNACWERENAHDLMDSLPGYNPDELDSRWKAHLVVVPATMNCSRGRMFDWVAGDVNEIAREGAVTYSHDGYPSQGQGEYGDAEDELQKDVPRAFLRSAAHEVGHTFNQIHQNLEGGNDNSIMTTTPAVSNVLAGAGEEFPDDIDLAFNATVRRHLIHLPDPAVRPGAMRFFSNAVAAPEADVNFFDAVDLEVGVEVKSRIKLGEPVRLRWTVTNLSDETIPVPEQVDADSQVASISVTDMAGSIRHMRAFMASPCTTVHVSGLEPGEARKADASLFWSQNGFAFDAPGRHRVEVILLWEIDGLVLGARGATEVWVDYPVTPEENEVAALMLNDEVGKLVARGGGSRYPKGLERAAKVLEKHGNHPACEVLRGLPGTTYGASQE